MKSSPLVLLFLFGIQDVLIGGGLVKGSGAANHKTGQQMANNQSTEQSQQSSADRLFENHLSQKHQRSSHHRNRKNHRSTSQTHDRSLAAKHPASLDPSIAKVDHKLFFNRRYKSSPRVVFSEVLPTYNALEGKGDDTEEVRGLRIRRRAGLHTMHRGVYSVCESMNTWVGNMTRATDIAGNEVTVLPNVTINNVVKKQFFFETTCRYTKSEGNSKAGWVGAGLRKPGRKATNAGCLGIDSRHWNSYCTNTHIFVSALTIFKERTAWRFIRINAACVCVLSRKSWSGRLPH